MQLGHFVPDNRGELMEGDSCEASDDVVVGNQAHWNLSDEEVELHFFDLVALHVGLHRRPHDVVRRFHHHEPGQLVGTLTIYPKHVFPIWIVSFKS